MAYQIDGTIEFVAQLGQHDANLIDQVVVVLIDAVHLKDMLGGIQTNSDNRHGTAPLAALHTSQPGTIDAVGAVHPNITSAA